MKKQDTPAMNIVWRDISELTPYERNAKLHPDEQIDRIANSLEAFGWQQTLVIDNNGVIIVGHGRLLAAQKLTKQGKKKKYRWNNNEPFDWSIVPCLLAEDMTEDEIKAYRLADNKLNESPWDEALKEIELADIEMDMEQFGFELEQAFTDAEEDAEYEQKKRDFEERMARGDIAEEDEEYQNFVEKFELKKTTDDCYTPQLVYEAVADWVAKEYRLSKKNFIRPFYPGGDYKNENYTKNSVVVDNPPFSILSEIIKFYSENKIKFFLFAPTLTLFSSSSSSSSSIPVGVDVVYENGANVHTSFVTNLEDKNIRVRSAPTLYQAVKAANDENLKEKRRELPKYEYCDYIVTSTRVGQFSRYCVNFIVPRDESQHIRQLDCQKNSNKAIYGSAFIISERMKAEKEKAEKEKAEKWELSEREMDIVRSLAK
jgi:ParB-like chromosome segregation protein Spo0J